MLQWLRGDPWQAFVLLLAPALLVGMLYSIFAPRSPTDLAVAIVDLDNSSLSRRLGRALQATPAATLRSYPTLAAAADSLRSGDSYAMVVIPTEFSADLQHNLSPSIELRYNGTYLLMARRLLSPLQQAIGSILTDAAGMSLAAKGVPLVAVAAQLAPVKVQVSALNNIGLDYAQFLMPPLALAIWQLCAMLSMINLLQRPPPGVSKRRALLPLVCWQWAWAGLGLLLLRPLLAIPVEASLWPLWLASAPMLLPLLALALLLNTSGREGTQQASSAAALLSPAFAFMGVTMPVGDMPAAAQWWGQLIPSTHFLPLLQSYRAGASADWLQLWPLFIVVPIVVVLWRKLT
ncbi:ABC transporter permease [Ferrimonas lipolytica]|uniref:ABC transporter permease n=1 Tax=Ferrimonas lipolytica TaxID=2724191 RepID=A0A6H1UHW4_9GAMM|nr:ABC transporter permease [Ferrimonas lipolytica]QIZ77903.1 ABC transporter permease [Ferrimonas lipolytica]